MAGYKGYSMSNNAVDAYSNGERPISKWSKADILTECRREGVSPEQIEHLKKFSLAELREIGLKRTSWHHTSSRYNATDFYSVDVSNLEKVRYEPTKQVKKQPTEEKWYAEYIVWTGTRKHPKANHEQSAGILKGNWFYLPDGTKKSINGSGFRLIRRV